MSNNNTWSNFDAIADDEGVTMASAMPDRHPVDAEAYDEQRPTIVMRREVVDGKRGYTGEIRGADATLWCMESMRTANGIREIWAVRCSAVSDAEPVTYWGSLGEVTEFLIGYMDTCDIDVEMMQ